MSTKTQSQRSKRADSISKERLEKEVEDKLIHKFPDVLFLKLHVRNWPDRLVVFPQGVTAFMELKKYGKEPRVPQQAAFQTLREMGHIVWVCDDVDDAQTKVKNFLAYQRFKH